MRFKRIDSIKNENKAIKLRRDEIEKEIKKLQKEDGKLYKQLLKNIEMLKKTGNETK